MSNLTIKDFQVGTKFKFQGSNNIYIVESKGNNGLWITDTFFERYVYKDGELFSKIEILEQPKKLKQITIIMNELQFSDIEYSDNYITLTSDKGITTTFSKGDAITTFEIKEVEND